MFNEVAIAYFKILFQHVGHAIADGVRAWVWQVGSVVDKVMSGQVFSEYFGFPPPKAFIPPTSPSSQSPGAGSRGLATS
jgi:hypothetical protein